MVVCVISVFVVSCERVCSLGVRLVSEEDLLEELTLALFFCDTKIYSPLLD